MGLQDAAWGAEPTRGKKNLPAFSPERERKGEETQYGMYLAVRGQIWPEGRKHRASHRLLSQFSIKKSKALCTTGPSLKS